MGPWRGGVFPPGDDLGDLKPNGSLVETGGALASAPAMVGVSGAGSMVGQRSEEAGGVFMGADAWAFARERAGSMSEFVGAGAWAFAGARAGATLTPAMVGRWGAALFVG